MTLRLVYAPSERHTCYTLRRGCRYAVAVHTTPGDIYACLQPIATFYLSAIAKYRMPHSPHICWALRICHILQYSLRFGYLACGCICFAIIVFYWSHIYSPIFTLSSTMPSVLHILHWSIMCLQCFFLLIRIGIVTILTLIPVTILVLIPIDIAGSEVKPLEFHCGPLSPAGGGDGIAIVAFITFIFVIPTAPWHHEIKFVICAIVVYRDVWVSASDLRLLKRHFGGQIIRKNSIVNTRCFHADHLGRCWILRLLDLTLDCSKSVVIHPLLVALW